MELQYDDRMPEWLHIGLVNHIQVAISPDDCRGLERTEAFLRAHHVDVPQALAWLNEHGAHCDCEVVFNTHPTICEPVH